MSKMVTYGAVAALGIGMAVGPASAEPGGCLKYGAIGAAGGHLLHHGVLGALGGCVTGMYRRHEYHKEQRALARQEREDSPVAAPGYRD